uniref:Uncharacterized protein n=1 Tax=Acrobeloides nanus TaxID=290746 RepID=A0A914CWP0_9BILA
MLLKRIPLLLDKYNSYAYFTEQAVEAVHQRIKELRKKICVNDEKIIHERLLKDYWIDNVLNDLTDGNEDYTKFENDESIEEIIVDEPTTSKQPMSTARKLWNFAKEGFAEAFDDLGSALSSGFESAARNIGASYRETIEIPSVSYLEEIEQELNEIQRQERVRTEERENQYNEMLKSHEQGVKKSRVLDIDPLDTMAMSFYSRVVPERLDPLTFHMADGETNTLISDAPLSRVPSDISDILPYQPLTEPAPNSYDLPSVPSDILDFIPHALKTKKQTKKVSRIAQASDIKGDVSFF